MGRAYSFPGLQKHRGIVCDRIIEKEIYCNCSIAPDTPAATKELLDQRAALLAEQSDEPKTKITLESNLKSSTGDPIISKIEYIEIRGLERFARKMTWSTGNYSNDRYSFTVDRDSVSIWSINDDRGLIYQVKNSSDPRRYEKALINFNNEDFKWFKNAEARLEAFRKEASRQSWIDKQQQKERQRRDGPHL